MTRSVEDAAHLYTVLQGPDPADPVDATPHARRPAARAAAGRGRAALGSPDRLRAARRRRRGARGLRRIGGRSGPGRRARRDSWRCRARPPEYGGDVGRLIGAEGYFHVGALVDDESLPIDDDVRPRIWLGKDVSAADYLALLRSREDDKRAALAAMEGFDALLTPGNADPGTGGRRHRPEPDAGPFHTHGQLARMVRPGGAQRRDLGRAADIAAHRLPGARRGDGAPHRLGLRAGHRLAPAHPVRTSGRSLPSLHLSAHGQGLDRLGLASCHAAIAAAGANGT